MRKLNTGDAYAFARLITKSGMREELKKISAQITKASNVDDVGFDAIFAMIGCLCGSAEERAFYDIIASVAGIDAVTVAELPVMEFYEIVRAIFTENRDFFTMLSHSLMKK